ncbi:HAD family hydrolase [Bailinhaonella thermotolerans]|nr:HAD family hydrolase [Bailinhaonella thermotolerans]
MSHSVIVFDGDDTLWECQRHFDEARAAVADYVSGLGLDADLWRQLQHDLDLDLVATRGMDRRRFPLSCELALEQVSHQVGRLVRDQDRYRVGELADRAHIAPVQLLPGVAEALARAAQSAPLMLLTCADPTVQRRRIYNSGLMRHFQGVRICPDKHAGIFASLMHDLQADRAHSWSIGNSEASDIVPALQAGMNAAWVPRGTWAHDLRPPAYRPTAPAGLSLRAEDLSAAVDLVLERLG